MSEAATLKTLFPVPYDVTLAGKPVKVGRLKLRQKAELQAWLDSLPEPNARVRSELDASEKLRGKWPLALSDLPSLLDSDFESWRKFLSVTLPPFNPGMSGEQIEALIEEVDDDRDLIAVMLAANGHDPNTPISAATKTEEPAEKKGDGSPPNSTTGP
jgi:hypothetical protein